MADQVASVFHALIDNVESIVRGKAESIRLALCCLLTEGHLLIDDVPGTGKTSMAKAIAGSIAGLVEACAVHTRPVAERCHRGDGLRPAHLIVLVSSRSRCSPTC